MHEETVLTGYVGTDGQIKLEKKISVFQKKRDTCGRGLKSDDGATARRRRKRSVKVNLCSFNLHRDYSNYLTLSNIGEIISKKKISEKEIFFVAGCSPT